MSPLDEYELYKIRKWDVGFLENLKPSEVRMVAEIMLTFAMIEKMMALYIINSKIYRLQYYGYIDKLKVNYGAFSAKEKIEIISEYFPNNRSNLAQKISNIKKSLTEMMKVRNEIMRKRHYGFKKRILFLDSKSFEERKTIGEMYDVYMDNYKQVMPFIDAIYNAENDKKYRRYYLYNEWSLDV